MFAQYRLQTATFDGNRLKGWKDLCTPAQLIVFPPEHATLELLHNSRVRDFVAFRDQCDFVLALQRRQRQLKFLSSVMKRTDVEVGPPHGFALVPTSHFDAQISQ